MTYNIQGVTELKVDTLVEATSKAEAGDIVDALIEVWSLKLKHQMSMLKFGSPKFKNLN